jgi:hypothetical protein
MQGQNVATCHWQAPTVSIGNIKALQNPSAALCTIKDVHRVDYCSAIDTPCVVEIF